MRKYPVGMVLGGYYYWDNGTLAAQGSVYSFYWSCFADASVIKQAFRLNLIDYNKTINPAGSGEKIFGFSLRCLAQNQIKNRPRPNKKTKQNNTTKQEGIHKSFRLPTGGPSGEYQTLYNNYNSWTAMQDSAGPQFVLSGDRNGTSPDGQGMHGYYRSSSASTDATRAYDLNFYGTYSTVRPAHNDLKRYGFTLRCLGLDRNKIFVDFYGLYNYNIIMIASGIRTMLFASSQLGRPLSLRLNHITAREI